MTGQSDKDKQFSVILDDLLAGKQVIPPVGDEDLRTTLAFALKMASLQCPPSPEFAAKLQARLSQELMAQEAGKKAKPGFTWFKNLLLDQPVLRAVAVFLVIGLVSLGMWRAGIFGLINTPPGTVLPTGTPAITVAPTTSPSATITPARTPLLTVTGTTTRPSYNPGEVVQIGVTLKNNTNNALLLEQYPPILSVMREQTRQPVYTFAIARKNISISRGEAVSYWWTWDQRDEQGKLVPPGDYYVELEDIDFTGQAVKLEFLNPVHVYINSLTGASIEKSLFLNQSVTDSGFTVTLQRLEMSGGGFWVYSSILPAPDNHLDGQTGLNATANYSLDGSWVKDTGISYRQYSDIGMNYVWFVPEPITGTGNLTFTVTSIGKWTGNWQFNIPLKG